MSQENKSRFLWFRRREGMVTVKPVEFSQKEMEFADEFVDRAFGDQPAPETHNALLELMAALKDLEQSSGKES